LKDLKDKIIKNATLSAQAKLAILRRLVNMESQLIVSKVEDDFEGYSEPEDVLELKDYKIREEIQAMNDNQIRTYVAANGAAQMKKLRIKHIIQEAIHCLKIKIFGNERLGLQSYVQLKRTMTTMKIGSKCDVKKWSQRFNTFQDYLPRCLWIAGAKREEWPEAYGEMRKREILEFALPPAYQKRLNADGWCLSEETYDKSIRKIAKVEPEILLKIKELKKTRENAKAIEELQAKVGVRTKSGKGKGKHKDKDKSTQKGDGPKDENGYYLYGNCGKTHKGVYRKPVKNSKQGGGDTPRK